MVGIIRDLKSHEKDLVPQGYEGESTGFIPLATGRRKKVLTPKDKFSTKLAEEQQKAQSKGLPFAWATAQADMDDLIERLDKQWKRNDFVDKSKIPEVDWSRYSNLKNFEVLGEGKTHDKELSKLHHLPVFVGWKRYRFKGFSNTYNIMESEEDALDRAREKHLLIKHEVVKKEKEVEKKEK